jgi:hypothetical protein
LLATLPAMSAAIIGSMRMPVSMTSFPCTIWV